MAVIVGTSGDDDPLNGTSGDDTIDGLGGVDVMVGGTGNDVYYVDNSSDQVIEAPGQGDDVIRTTANYTLGADQEVEHLRALGTVGLTLTGNGLDNHIIGSSGDDTLNGVGGNDILSGRSGADTMAGGAGNDIYYVDNAGDQVLEEAGGGRDTIYSTVDYVLATGQEVEYVRALGTMGLTLTGNELGNHLIGSSGIDTLNGAGGNDILSGAGGDDVMAGGTGNDVYYVDDTDDQVIEAVGQGTDVIRSSVNYALAAGQEVEYLRALGTGGLTLTGNELRNVLIGSDGDDTLSGGTGNDSISGGDGKDTLITNGDSAFIRGGDGDDAIRLDGASTSTGRVDGGAGNDTVHSADLGQFVIQNVETLDTYYGFTNGSVAQFASFNAYTAILGDPVNGTQISFSLRGAGGTLDFTTGITGKDSVEIRDGGLTSGTRITGSDNADQMVGSAFTDVFQGGKGDDTLFGGDGRDRLYGGFGDDLLNGGTGNDTMNGSGGSDTFSFDTPFAGGNNIDLVADFTSGIDTIQLDQTFYYTGLAVGQLAAAQFSATGTATGSGPQIVYDQTTGALFYDSNGTDAGGAAQFATLKGTPTLSNTDFEIV